MKGMKRRPWILIVLAILHAVAPFFNLISDALWAGFPVFYYIELFFQPHNFQKHWFHFFAPMMAGLMIYICRKWSLLTYVTIMVSLAFVSYNSYATRWDLFNPTPLIVAYTLNIGFVIYFLLPAVRSVYLDPRLRWWETSPRYQTDIHCVFSAGDFLGSGNIGNFSQSGLFLKSEKIPADHAMIKIEFTYDGLPCQFQGQVIHHAKLISKGFGVQFTHSPPSKKTAKALADRLQLKGLLMPGRTFTAEDTFRWWLRQLVRTGQGLMPMKSNSRTTSSESKTKN